MIFFVGLHLIFELVDFQEQFRLNSRNVSIYLWRTFWTSTPECDVRTLMCCPLYFRFYALLEAKHSFNLAVKAKFHLDVWCLECLIVLVSVICKNDYLLLRFRFVRCARFVRRAHSSVRAVSSDSTLVILVVHFQDFEQWIELKQLVSIYYYLLDLDLWLLFELYNISKNIMVFHI